MERGPCQTRTVHFAHSVRLVTVKLLHSNVNNDPSRLDSIKRLILIVRASSLECAHQMIGSFPDGRSRTGFSKASTAHSEYCALKF